jgi:hypothetical protein
VTESEKVLLYIVNDSREENDYIEQCEENEWLFKTLAPNKEIYHIYEQAAYALVFEYGYDLEGWTILTEKQWNERK